MIFFGLANALGSFQDYVNKILAEKLDIIVIVYLNDLFIYTEDLGKSHVKEIQWILEVLKKYGLYANLKRCHFYHDKVRFLDFVISMDGIKMEEERINAVKKWYQPKAVQNI